MTNSIANLDEAYAEIRGSMAMHFPFELDTFQKEAICNLEMVRLQCQLVTHRKCV